MDSASIPILLILEPQVTVQPCLTHALILAHHLARHSRFFIPVQALRAGSPGQACVRGSGTMRGCSAAPAPRVDGQTADAPRQIVA